MQKPRGIRELRDYGIGREGSGRGEREGGREMPFFDYVMSLEISAGDFQKTFKLKNRRSEIWKAPPADWGKGKMKLSGKEN